MKFINSIPLSSVLGLATCQSKAIKGQVAYSYKGDSTFPTAEQWETGLNATIGGRLAKCTVSACVHENLPLYHVRASSAEDLSKAVVFANKYNLRLTVNNTGHDFMQRSTGLGSLLISISEMKGTKFVPDWSPSVGAEAWKTKQNGQKQVAVIINAGERQEDAIGQIEKQNKYTAVHADATTVGSAGGWVQGGGHGPLSSMFGMGADNVLEMTVVLPSSGKIVVANGHSYEDLFYALRGGGGGTFGIVSRIVMKAYPLPKMTGVVFTASTIGNNSDGYLNAISYLMSALPDMTEAGITGCGIYNKTGYNSAYNAVDKTEDQAKAAMAPIVKNMKELGANVGLQVLPDRGSTIFGNTMFASDSGNESSYSQTSTNMRAQFGQAQAGLRKRHSPTEDYSTYMTSRLLSRELLTSPSNTQAIKKMLIDLGNNANSIMPCSVVGGQVAKNRNLDIALNSAWRDSIVHMLVLGDKTPASRLAMNPLSVRHGVYWNEGDRLEADWKTSFFGGEKQYEKLLAIKKKYDPQNRLWCTPCVGGDMLKEGPDEKIYVA